MTKKEIRQFVKERDAALLSLDESIIRAYLKKRGVPIPESDIIFWAGVYKCVCNINSAPEDKKEIARQWLKEHDMSEDIL